VPIVRISLNPDYKHSLRCPMGRCSYTRRRLFFSNSEHAAIGLHSGPGAPSGNERARKSGVEEIDRHSVIQHPRSPDGVIAQPSAPQFASSQVVMSA
jgi:hypothetical protein